MFYYRTAAIVLRQFYLIRGSMTRVFPLFMWVAIDIVLWGFITRYLNSVTPTNVNFVPALLGAVILWGFFGRIMHGVTTAFFEDVWSRNFLNMFATPLSVLEYISGLIVTSILSSAIGIVVMFVLATGIFGLDFTVYGVMLIPFLLLLFVFGITLGILGVGVVLRLGPASEWFIWPVPGFISPFVGVFYPVSTLPVWMQHLAHALPPSYVFEGMRAIVSRQTFDADSLIVAAALDFVYLLLACWFFQRTFKRSVRTGLLARYSAESTT